MRRCGWWAFLVTNCYFLLIGIFFLLAFPVCGGRTSNEAVQEFGVHSNGYGAESGRAGGAIVNVVTKPGTNHFQGRALIT